MEAHRLDGGILGVEVLDHGYRGFGKEGPVGDQAVDRVGRRLRIGVVWKCSRFRAETTVRKVYGQNLRAEIVEFMERAAFHIKSEVTAMQTE
jgi:hypothetical protein